MLDQALTFADGFDGARWTVALLSLLTSLGYLLLVDRTPSMMRTGLKTAAIGLLVILPFLGLHLEGAAPGALIVLAAALLFSSLGDYFLSLADEERNFPRGLVSFLIAHVFYLIVLLPRAEMPAGGHLAGAIAIVVLAGATLFWLWPNLGALRLPVLVYLTVISAMAIAAFSVPLPWLGLGALLFVFSDAVIAVDKFRKPVPFRGPIIWITYYAGQALIALSLLALLR